MGRTQAPPRRTPALPDLWADPVHASANFSRTTVWSPLNNDLSFCERLTAAFSAILTTGCKLASRVSQEAKMKIAYQIAAIPRAQTPSFQRPGDPVVSVNWNRFRPEQPLSCVPARTCAQCRHWQCLDDRTNSRAGLCQVFALPPTFDAWAITESTDGCREWSGKEVSLREA